MSRLNTSAKGRRLEYRSRQILEGAGYSVIRSAASKGSWDLIGISSADMVLVQCKSNRPPSPAERETLKLFPCPPNCKKLIHVFHDRQRWPVVTEL